MPVIGTLEYSLIVTTLFSLSPMTLAFRENVLSHDYGRISDVYGVPFLQENEVLSSGAAEVSGLGKDVRSILTDTPFTTSVSIQECENNGQSNCVVNAFSPVNCTCNIALSYFDICNPYQPMRITLDKDKYSSHPSLDKMVPYKVINNETVELYVHEMDAGEYFIFCSDKTEDNWSRVNYYFTVVVGYPPLDVANFSCVSYNWQELLCRWDFPYNPARGNDIYKPWLMNPDEVECSWGGDCPYDDQKLDCCFWTLVDGYAPQNPDLTMNFIIKDVFTEEEYEFSHPIDYLGVVLPNPAEDLKLEDIIEDIILVNWSTPSPLVEFPADLYYRIDYRINSSHCGDGDCSWQLASTGNCSKVLCNGHVSVPYPGIQYDVAVRLRSGAAKINAEEDGWWSHAADVSAVILPQRPWVTPVTTLGTFQAKNNRYDSGRRDVTIAWQPLHFTQFNGPDFKYLVRTVGSDGLCISERNIPFTDTSLSFVNFSMNVNYTFEIKSVNSKGESNASSVILVPESLRLPSLPVLPAVVYHTELEIYHLRWQGEKKSLRYTVFLCLSDSGKDQDPCKGNLHWKQVGSETSVNVTLDDFGVTVPEGDVPLRFAVSSEADGDVSSGMSWSCCSHPQPYSLSRPSRPEIKEVTEVVDSGALLKWNTAQCSDWGSIIEGVRVEYCPGEFESVTNCSELQRIERRPIHTSVIDCLNTLLLSGLQPGTNYSTWLTLLSPGGESSRSRGIVFATEPSDTAADLLTWEIILLALGCLLAVIVILAVGKVTFRKVIFLKKQFDIKPEVPPALVNNLGNLREVPTKEINSCVRHPIPDLGDVIKIRNNQGSSPYLDPKLRSESMTTKSNLLNETLGDSFKPEKRPGDEQASLMTDEGTRDAPVPSSESKTSTNLSQIPSGYVGIDPKEPSSLTEESSMTSVQGPSDAAAHAQLEAGNNGYVCMPEGFLDGIMYHAPTPSLNTSQSDNFKSNLPNKNAYVSINFFGDEQGQGLGSPSLENKRDSNPSGYVSVEDSNKWVENKTPPMQSGHPDRPPSKPPSSSGYVSVDAGFALPPTFGSGYVTLNDLRNIIPSGRNPEEEDEERALKKSQLRKMSEDEIPPGYCRLSDVLPQLS